MIREGDTYPNTPDNVTQWHQLYTNQEPETGLPSGAPNYAQTIGRLVAGLFQQQPVTMPITEGQTPVIDDGGLADLTDRGVKRAVAESVVFIRPARVAGMWQPALLGCSQVDSEWAHGHLQRAVVWKTIRRSDGHVMLLEEYVTNPETGEQSSEASLWETTKHVDKWKLGSRIETQPDEGDSLYRQVNELNTQPRRMFAYPWDIENGQPVPIYHTNEHLIANLNQLAMLEREDTGMPRNIIAVSEESMNASMIDDGSDPNTGWGRLRGLRKGRNMLRVPSDQLAQHGTEAFIKHLRLADDTVQRDRIERLEDVFYMASGISPTTLGRNITGRSDSGAAKRADSQLTLTTIAGPARRWAQTLTDVAAHIATLEGADGVAGPVQVTEGLKTSADERADMVQTLRNSDAISVEQAVREVNPDWDDEQVAAEVARIRVDNQLVTASDGPITLDM